MAVTIVSTSSRLNWMREGISFTMVRRQDDAARATLISSDSNDMIATENASPIRTWSETSSDISTFTIHIVRALKTSYKPVLDHKATLNLPKSDAACLPSRIFPTGCNNKICDPCLNRRKPRHLSLIWRPKTVLRRDENDWGDGGLRLHPGTAIVQVGRGGNLLRRFYKVFQQHQSPGQISAEKASRATFNSSVQKFNIVRLNHRPPQQLIKLW